MNTSEFQPRRIRSYVRRDGRLTGGQQKALDELWSDYGLETDDTWTLDTLFPKVASVTLEIGFGNGTSLAQMAEDADDQNFIGIEIHRPGVGHLLRDLQERKLSNVKVASHDAVEVLQQNIPDSCLDRALLFFPDPWPKQKHKKRRIIQPEFVALIARKLKAGGTFHMATDWQAYAKYMLKTMDASPEFNNCSGTGNYAEKPSYRPITKFERRGQRLGHGVWDLIYQNSIN